MSALIPAWFLACGLVSASGVDDRGAATAPTKKTIDVLNVVDGRTPIVSLKPEGARVAKGELVCELEAFAIRERLPDQGKAVAAAEKVLDLARRDRVAAEGEVTEYAEGQSKRETQMIKSEIALDELKLKVAEDRLVRSRRLHEQGKLARGWVTSDELGVQKARLALEKLQRKRETLEKFTRDKTIKILQSKVERARSEELAKKAIYAREQSARDHLLEQIEKCKVLAPADGTVTYAQTIEEGAEVVKGQLLFRIAPGPPAAPGAEAKSAADRGLSTNRR
jgi:HlyD family secretion protein